MNDKKVTYAGVGVIDLLGIIFIALKLAGVINWSWVWVISPFWIPVALVFLLCMFAVICIDFKGDEKHRKQ